MKIPNIFGGDKLIITKTEHGEEQNFKAMDFDACCLYAPFNGCKIGKIHKHKILQQSWFELILPDGSIILHVHGYPTKIDDLKAGDVYANTYPYYDKKGKRADHWHIAIQVKGKYDLLLNYIDQKTKLTAISGIRTKFTDWLYYQNKELNIKTETEKWLDDVNKIYGVDLLGTVDTSIKNVVGDILRNTTNTMISKKIKNKGVSECFIKYAEYISKSKVFKE